MSKMSRLDYAIKQYFKDHIAYIVTTIIVFIIAVLMYADDYRAVQEKENRINTIEERLTKQEHYMHQAQADVDNLKEVIDR